MAEIRKEVLLRLPPELWQRAREKAQENCTNVTTEINRALEERLSMRALAGISDGALPTYAVSANCSNCGFSGPVEIPRGTGLEMVRCPICACVRRLQRT